MQNFDIILYVLDITFIFVEIFRFLVKLLNEKCS